MTDEEVVETYLKVVSEYTDGDADATEFSTTFFDEFKREGTDYSEATYEILQALFVAADAYCEDPRLRDERDVDEAELSRAAREAATKLRARRREVSGDDDGGADAAAADGADGEDGDE